MLDVLREEKKYRLSTMEASRLFSVMSQVLQGDPYNGLNSYMVRSLYFDTIQDQDYFEKDEGVEYRKKIRIRVYDASAQKAKLEMKEKCGVSQRKRSLTISREDAMALIDCNYEVLLKYEEPLAMEFYLLMTTELYRPKCVVQYNRIAFATNENNIRITYDSDISSNEGYFNIFDEHLPLYSVLPQDQMVLEVKYNNFLLSYIKDTLLLADKTETANSKYCLCRKYGMMIGD